ncbi:MAG: hypothetical protein LBF19_04355 [Prevotellaceae bacterium]|jgi:hypothetical protein|nr:hypothetical protein [Prevotellaceae bacterium]
MVKKNKEMTGTLPDKNQRELFRPLLVDMIDKRHELALLADTVDGGLPAFEVLRKFRRRITSQGMNRKSLHAILLWAALF